jgi:hypothetical protein
VLRKRKVEAHGDFILGPVSPKEYKDTVAELNGSQTNRVFEFFKINPPERVGFAKHREAVEKKAAALAAAEADAEETATSPRAAPNKAGRRGAPAAATATAEGKAWKKRGGRPADCWGRWPSEASPTSGQADNFSSRAVSVTRRDLRIMGLTETLMPLMSPEFCCAGMVLRGDAGVWCRRHRWLHFGDEGSRGQKHCAPAGDIVSGASSGTGEMSEKARRDQSRILGCFGTEGVALLDTWLPPTCKEGTA